MDAEGPGRNVKFVAVDPEVGNRRLNLTGQCGPRIRSLVLVGAHEQPLRMTIGHEHTATSVRRDRIRL